MWNHRLLKMIGNAKFANLIERTLYNGLLSGVGLSGDKFFYVNPLSSDGDHHRKGWFHVSCCPPNIARLLASLQKYIYLKSENKVYVNLFISSELKFEIADQQILLKQSSEYPWHNSINYNIKTEKSMNFTLNIRYPDWAKKVKVLINEKEEEINVENGYLVINRNWKTNDQVELIFEMPIRRIKAHPNVVENRDRFALMKGPLIYCLEEVDNEDLLDEIIIPRESKIEAEYEEILNGINVLKGDALKEDLSEWKSELYRDEKNINYKTTKFKAIPYYIWDHRESGEMRVWLRE